MNQGQPPTATAAAALEDLHERAGEEEEEENCVEVEEANWPTYVPPLFLPKRKGNDSS